MATMEYKYPVQIEIKARAKAAGLSMRDLAAVLGESPGTTGSRLNGFIPFSPASKQAILKAIETAEIAAKDKRENG